MVDFSSLRNKSLDNLKKQFDNIQTKGFKSDERYWTLTRDKADNGSAVIRFLPAPPADLERNPDAGPFIRYWDHAFKGPGGWYIEKSLTTLELDDPVSEANGILWDSGIEANKKLASSRKRRLHFVSNILVVNDPAQPENNGKIFLFAYGKRIFDMLQDAAFPQFEGMARIDAFDMENGANFNLRARKHDGFVTYDKSSFAEPGPAVNGGEKALEAIWRAEYSLVDLIAPSEFKSYDELKKKFDKVVGRSGPVRSDDDDVPFDMPSDVEEDEPMPTRPARAQSTEDVKSRFARFVE
jgi:hypothetical protein